MQKDGAELSEGGGTPISGSGNYDSFGSNGDHIEKALEAMANTLKTVKDFLNFFVKQLWDKIVKKDFIHLKTNALNTLGPEKTPDETSQGWTINRLLNSIIRLCEQPKRLMDSKDGPMIRERIKIRHLSAEVIDFEGKVLKDINDWLKERSRKQPFKRIRKWPFKKVFEIVLKGLKAANTILRSLKKVWHQLEAVTEFKEHLENLIA